MNGIILIAIFSDTYNVIMIIQRLLHYGIYTGKLLSHYRLPEVLQFLTAC